MSITLTADVSMATGSWSCIILGIVMSIRNRHDARRANRWYYGMCAVANVSTSVFEYVSANYAWGSFNALIAAWMIWHWWRNRGDGGRRLRKTLKDAGEKSRAVIQDMVDRLTPSPIPVPVGG